MSHVTQRPVSLLLWMISLGYVLPARSIPTRYTAILRATVLLAVLTASLAPRANAAAGIMADDPTDDRTKRSEVVFIDTGVADGQTLADGVDPSAEVILVDRTEKDVRAMADVTASNNLTEASSLLTPNTFVQPAAAPDIFVATSNPGDFTPSIDPGDALLKISGGTTSTVFSESLVENANAVAVDLANDRAWILGNSSPDDIIFEVNLSTGVVSNLHTSAVKNAGDIEYDSENNDLYFTSSDIFGTNEVRLSKFDLDDNSVSVIASGFDNNATGLAIDVANDRAWTYSNSDDRITQITLSTGASSFMLSGTENINDLEWGATEGRLYLVQTEFFGSGANRFGYTGPNGGSIININTDRGYNALAIDEASGIAVASNASEGIAYQIDLSLGTSSQVFVGNTATDPTNRVPRAVAIGSAGSVASAPTVSTTAESSVTSSSAVLGGNVTDDGGATVTERGVVYSTSNTSPTTSDTKDTNGSGTGSFSETISGLSASTTYYFRAYAINSEGTSYGSADQFTTGNTAPVFTQTTSSTSFAENGTGVVFDFNANDGDGGTDDTSVSYSLGGTDAGAFTIDAATGALSFNAAPDFETPTDSDSQNDYVVDVTADDGAATNNTTTQTITVTVTDVNEAPAGLAFSPASPSIDENNSTPVTVTTIAIQDDALGANMLSITGGDTGDFQLNGNDLQFTTAADFESKSTFTVDISVDDTNVGGSPDATETLTLTITDVNEPPTLALSTTTPSLVENNTTPIAVATITINDDPAGTNALSLSGTDASDFQINGSDLEFTAVADFETKSSYDVTVEVDDTALGGGAEDTEAVTLTITDAVEAPTATTNAASGITVTEATLNGTAGTGGGPDATVTFEYYVTANGSGTATTINATPNTVTSASATAVSASVTGLQPNTQYTYEVIAASDEGTTNGGTQTFTTSAAPEIAVTDGTNPLPSGSGTFDFGTVDGVATNPAQTFTIENNGSANLTVSGVTLSNTDDFTLTPPPASSVGAGSSTDFIVQFDASVPGPYSTTVTIDNNDADENPYTFTVDAAAGAPEADLFVGTSPRTALANGGTFDFGSVTVGASSTETFTIENNGDATLAITPPSSIPGVFNVMATGGTTPPLAPGQAFTFDVTFEPSSSTGFSEPFSVTNNDPDENPYNVALTGTGAPRQLAITDGSADGLDFDASVAPGTANNAVGIFALSADVSGATLDGVTINSNSPGISGISAARLFGSSDAALDVGSDTELATVATDDNSAPETIAFSGFSDPIPTSTRYLILAIDVDAGASASDVQFFLNEPSDLTINGAATISEVNGVLVATEPIPRVQMAFASLPLSNGATALPVEFTTFEGTAARTASGAGRQHVDLQWSTASETSNAGFEVQRRPDSTATWTALAFVEGTGTTDEPQTYRFRDTDVPFAAEQLTYRLRQVDTGGTESFSEPFVMDVPMPASATLQAPFPSPARNTATLRYTLAEPTDVQLRVYDLLGRQVQTLAHGAVEAGRHEMQIATHRLAAGTYFVRMIAGDTVQTQRLTIVR